MDRTNFTRILQGRLAHLLKRDGSRLFLGGLSFSDTENVIDTIFDSIIDTVGEGAEVRFRFGAFRPKFHQRDGVLTNVKMGFTSFSHTNRALWDKFKESNLPGITAKQHVEVYNSKGHSHVVDENGEKLFTLTEISTMSKVSVPTCYRYLKILGDDVPSREIGNGTRYPREVADMFAALKQKNMRKTKGDIVVDGEPLFTISHISRETGVNPSTIKAWVQTYGVPFRSLDNRILFTQDACNHIDEIRQNSSRSK